MSQSGKLARIFLVLLVIISLALASAAAILLQKEMKKSSKLDAKLSQALDQEKSAQSTLDTSKQEISRLNELLGQSEGRIAQMQESIATLENEKKTLADTLSDLKSRLDVVQKDNSASLKIVESLKGDLAQKKQQLEAATKEKEELVTKLGSLELKNKEPVRLDKIVVRPGGQPVVGLEAKIASVDKKFKFLIIDKGQKDGVNVGDVFTCLDKDRDIGQVEVEKVYDSLASARFLPNLETKNLKAGSRIVRK